MFGQTMVHLLEVQGMQPHKDGSSAHKNSPVRFMVGCSSSPDTPGEVRFHMMDQQSQPSIQLKPAAISVLFRIATDGSFANYYSEAHLPLSLLQGKLVYVELSLLAPLAPNLVLVVHSCLAYTLAPYVSWILLYDSCSSQGFSQLLPSPDTHHIRRIKITSFPSLPLESSTHTAHRGYSLLQDPEIYFLCLTETCSAADGSCSIGCIKGPNSDMQAMK
ncbi:zona pellucida sperm-binding protein 1-like isoform X2 [Leuresthes tenuis]|uniref:zona pellucida sperm-binding protein 1-like isoform X2 n=1 Tax=Leuresthes tenuis TaxID=355514 RepID=UPI003B509F21